MFLIEKIRFNHNYTALHTAIIVVDSDQINMKTYNLQG